MANQQSGNEKKGHATDQQALSIRESEKKVDVRLREVLGNESLASFSRRCGISEGGLRKYLEGASPSTINLIAMADTANVNIEWLAAGRGPKKRGAELRYSQHALNPGEDGGGDASKAPFSSVHTIPPASPIQPSVFHIEDIHRLTLAIEAVEEGLGRIYSSIPADKRAKLVAAAYDLLINEDQKDNVIKFIKLAA